MLLEIVPSRSRGVKHHRERVIETLDRAGMVGIGWLIYTDGAQVACGSGTVTLSSLTNILLEVYQNDPR